MDGDRDVVGGSAVPRNIQVLADVVPRIEVEGVVFSREWWGNEVELGVDGQYEQQE